MSQITSTLMAKVKRKRKPYKLILTQDVLCPLTISKGDRLGQLTIISEQPQIIDNRKVYYVSCSCGNVLYMNGLQWLRQEKKRCGHCVPYKIQGSHTDRNNNTNDNLNIENNIETNIEEIEIKHNIEDVSENNVEHRTTTGKLNNFNIYQFGKAKLVKKGKGNKNNGSV